MFLTTRGSTNNEVSLLQSYNTTMSTVSISPYFDSSKIPAELLEVVAAMNEVSDAEYPASEFYLSKHHPCHPKDTERDEYTVSHNAERLGYCLVLSESREFFLRDSWDGVDHAISPSTVDQAIAEMVGMMKA